MALEDLEEQFLLFDLPVYATLNDVDEQYHHMSLELYKQKASNPDLVRDRQNCFDDAYYKLLQHFVSQDCKEGQQRRAKDVSFANIEFRRLEPGVIQTWYNSAKQKNNKNQKSADTTSIEEDTMIMEDKESEDDMANERPQRSKKTISDDEDTGKVFDIIETEGDIFEVPDNAVIVHSVNCQGVWGAGFALELKKRFPVAFSVYAQKCRSTKPRSLLAGNCLLIPPKGADYMDEGEHQPRRWIACLFTSEGYGSPSYRGSNPGKDDQETILMHTDSALLDLRSKVTSLHNSNASQKPGDLCSSHVNAGRFGVPWELTRKLIATCFAGYPGAWNVVVRPQEV